MNHAHTGIAMGLGSGFAAVIAWILSHIQAIDGILQLVVLLLSLATCLIGLRKVTRERRGRWGRR